MFKAIIQIKYHRLDIPILNSFEMLILINKMRTIHNSRSLLLHNACKTKPFASCSLSPTKLHHVQSQTRETTMKTLTHNAIPIKRLLYKNLLCNTDQAVKSLTGTSVPIERLLYKNLLRNTDQAVKPLTGTHRATLVQKPSL